MRTLEVVFTESEKLDLINRVVEMAESEDKCHEADGHEFLPFAVNDELSIIATVLINDEHNSRFVSTDIKLITLEGFFPVISNLDSKFENEINKALIANFRSEFL